MMIVSMVLAAMIVAAVSAPPVLEGITELRGRDSGRAQRAHEERMQRMRHRHERWRERVNERQALREQGHKTIGRALQNRLAQWIDTSDERIRKLDDDFERDAASTSPRGTVFGRFKTELHAALRRRRQNAHARFRDWASRAEERLQRRFEQQHRKKQQKQQHEHEQEPAEPAGPAGDDRHDTETDGGPVWVTCARGDEQPPAQPAAIENPPSSGMPPVITPPGLLAAERTPKTTETDGATDAHGVPTVVPGEVVGPEEENDRGSTPQRALDAAKGEMPTQDTPTPGEYNNVIALPQKGTVMTMSENALRVESGEIRGPKTAKAFAESVSNLFEALGPELQLAGEQMDRRNIDSDQVARMKSVHAGLVNLKADLDVLAKNFEDHGGAQEHANAVGAGTAEDYLANE